MPALTLLEAGRFPEALAEARAVLRRRPRAFLAHRIAVEAAAAEGGDGLIALLEEAAAVPIGPEQVRILVRRAMVRLAEIEDPLPPARALRHAATRHGWPRPDLLPLLRSLTRTGRHETVLREAEALLRDEPQRAEAWRLALGAAAELGKAASLAALLRTPPAEITGKERANRTGRALARLAAAGSFEAAADLAEAALAQGLPAAVVLPALLPELAEAAHAPRLQRMLAAIGDADTSAAMAACSAAARFDLEAAENAIAAVDRAHPMRLAAALAIHRAGRRLYADTIIHRYGMEAIEREAEPEPGTLLHTMKAAGSIGRLDDAHRLRERLRAALAAIRTDPGPPIRPRERLCRIGFELFDIRQARQDVAALAAAREGKEIPEQGRFDAFLETCAAEFAWSEAAVDALLAGHPVRFPPEEALRIEVPRLKAFGPAEAGDFEAALSWVAVVEEACRRAREAGGAACIVPEWLAEAAARQCPPPAVLSYHTEGVAEGRTHFKEADLPRYMIFDRGGYSGWSTLADATPAQLGLDDIPLGEAEAFHAEFRDAVLAQNISKYEQPERGTVEPLPPRYVFVALQILTDRVQALARVPMLEMLDIVARRFAGTDIAVVVKRHPRCTDPRTADALASLSEAELVIRREDSIHDLIGGAEAVITTNSGVGSEALVHLKPVYLFGRADYAAVTHTVVDASSFRNLTSPIRLPVPEAMIKRFLFFYRRRWLVDTHDSRRLAEAIRPIVADGMRRAATRSSR